MATQGREHGEEDPTGHEVDRHVDAQPPREDLLEPDEIEVDAGDEGLDPEEVSEPARTGDPERLPGTEDLPESQGADVVESERLAEDEVHRPPLHDEEE